MKWPKSALVSGSPLPARRPSLHKANMPSDWQTYAQVEAGRPFYPLFKDEVLTDPSLLEPTHQPSSGTNISIQYPSAYNSYTRTAFCTPPSRSTYSPDVLVIQSSAPDTVLVTTVPESVDDTGTECTLARILNVLSTLRAKGLASVKHVADLRSEDGDQRLGIVLQQELTIDGAGGGVEELVRGLAVTSEDGGEGSECCNMDDEGWSYV